MTPALTWAAVRAAWGTKSQCPQTTTFLKRKESRSGIEPAKRLTTGPNRLTKSRSAWDELFKGTAPPPPPPTHPRPPPPTHPWCFTHAAQLFLLPNSQSVRLCQWRWCFTSNYASEDGVSPQTMPVKMVFHLRLCQWRWGYASEDGVSPQTMPVKMMFHLRLCQWR